MRVIVTGAAGFIGSHTVDLLLARGHNVIGIDNFRSGSEENIRKALSNERFMILRGDLREPSLMRALFEQAADAVIHLAGMVSVSQSLANPVENFELNVAMADRTMCAAMHSGVKRFVFASSAAVYGSPKTLPLTEETACSPLSPYGAAKLAVENLLTAYAHSFSMEAVSLRYFNVYGSRQNPLSEYSGVITRFFSNILQDGAVTIHGDGKQTRDFVSVHDVATVNVAAATSPGVKPGIYNVCAGTETSIIDLATEIGRCLSQAVEIRYAAALASDIRHSLGDPTRLLKQGWLKTPVQLSAGLQHMSHSVVG